MTDTSTTTTAKQRIDKWLWHARFFKTRTLAAKVVEGGHCRINRERVRKPGHAVKPGDVLTFAQGHDIRVIEVSALGERRGPAPEARQLYKDLDPPPVRSADPEKRELAESSVPQRDKGAGRPTKRDRRQMEKVQGL